MKKYKEWTYTDKIRWRIRALWALLACMLVYMVLVGVLGGGDSRVMTPLARLVSRVIFFGGFGYAAYRIHFNRKLLSNQCLLKEQWKHTQDERNRYLHDKSGGIVVDLLLVLLLFIKADILGARKAKVTPCLVLKRNWFKLFINKLYESIGSKCR